MSSKNFTVSSFLVNMDGPSTIFSKFARSELKQEQTRSIEVEKRRVFHCGVQLEKNIAMIRTRAQSIKITRLSLHNIKEKS